MLLITFNMIHIYFIYIFKCNLVYIVLLMCNDTHVPHKFLLQMFITSFMYMFVTFIKVKWDIEKMWNIKKKHFNCLINSSSAIQ